MESPILEVEGLQKAYQLSSGTPSGAWGRAAAVLGLSQGPREPLLALQDVTFSLDRGDVLGIVGRNGAGKSTLLRILAEVTPPTAGKVTFRGSVMSILEVGTGFHPDLSGRQNVFMSAAIHGLSRKAVQERFEEIVAFSGIGKFIDMPVKHYSSGMYMRLAFSVAFHAEADILLLDEVLSVGDVEFRTKSAQKIRQIARSGTTVLIVSHELPSIRSLCNKCLLLEAGRVRAFGPTRAIVDDYLSQYFDDRTYMYRSPDNPDAPVAERVTAHDKVSLLSMSVQAAGKPPGAPIHMADAVEVRIRYQKHQDAGNIELLVNLNNLDQVLLSDSRIYREGFAVEPQPAGAYEVLVTIPGNLLYTGTFYVDVYFGDMATFLLELPCLDRFVVEVTPWEVGKPWNMGQQDYALRPKLEWSLRSWEAELIKKNEK